MWKILGMIAVALALCGVAAACPPIAVSSYGACATSYATTYAVPVTTVQIVNPFVPQVQLPVQVQQLAPPVQVPQAECVPAPQAAMAAPVTVQSYAATAPVAVQSYAAVAVRSVAVQAYAAPLVAVPAYGYGRVAVAVNHGVRVAVVRAPARVAVVRVAARGQRVGLIGRLTERRAAIKAVRAAR